MCSSHAQEGHDPDGLCWCFPVVVPAGKGAVAVGELCGDDADAVFQHQHVD